MPVEFEELGQVLPPQQGGGGGTWSSWLADPVNRAGLLSFGLQMMSGSGAGSFTGELAAGVGKGFEGAAATEALQHKRAEADEEQAIKQAEGAATRASHEKIASESRRSQEKIAAANRANQQELLAQRIAGQHEGINLRNAAAWDRAQLRATTGGGGLTMNQALQRALELHEEPLSFDALSPEKRAKVLGTANELMDADQARRAGGAPAAAAGAAAGQGQMTWEQVQGDKELMDLLRSNPQYRAHAKQKFPHLRQGIEELEKQGQ